MVLREYPKVGACIWVVREEQSLDSEIEERSNESGIDTERWSEREPDNYDVTFEKMFDIEFPRGDLVHIGFSLGAFLGIVNHTKFIND